MTAYERGAIGRGSPESFGPRCLIFHDDEFFSERFAFTVFNRVGSNHGKPVDMGFLPTVVLLQPGKKFGCIVLNLSGRVEGHCSLG